MTPQSPKKRGGRRPNAGRPRAADPLQPFTIRIPASLVPLARSQRREIRDKIVRHLKKLRKNSQ